MQKNNLKKYFIPISGYVFVNAESREKAKEKIVSNGTFKGTVQPRGLLGFISENILKNIGVVLALWAGGLFVKFSANLYNALISVYKEPFIVFLLFGGYVALLLFLIKTISNIKFSRWS